jgi:2',3'-cyclic-nucleotide 2'-phosphodiesterase/3'-nucleotidase
LHTTDLHGHILPTTSYEGVTDVGGLARCATQIRQWQKENPHALLLDIGDVYQGTEVGLRTRGGVMIEALAALRYDAWVVGNHEFDWGLDPLIEAVNHSPMPVLAANYEVGGKRVAVGGQGTGLGKLQPYFIKAIAGFKIGVVGVTTPGLPYWLAPELTGELKPFDPVVGLKAAVAEMKSQGVDAIVVAGHMGLKGKTGDDFANQVNAVTAACPDAAVYLAGHTHKDVPSERVNGVLFTQANYYGINAGRVDLVFDVNSRKLRQNTAVTKRMDSTVALDPVVLSLAKPYLHESEQALQQPVGELLEPLSASALEGQASDLERLIGTALMRGLQLRQTPVAAVVHGKFSDNDWAAGPKTVDDLWKIMPYENFVVTGEFTPGELTVIAEDTLWGRDRRGWMGLQPVVQGKKVMGWKNARGERLEAGTRYRVAFNSYDAASGGQRFMKLRELMERPETKRTLHRVQSREALVEFFAEKKKIRKADLI